jgi:putative spermidine/putrescine transport system permease protein
MGTYEIPLLLGRQSPSMLSVLVIRKLQRFNLADIPQAYAISVIYIILVSIILMLVYRSQRKFTTTKTL